MLFRFDRETSRSAKVYLTVDDGRKLQFELIASDRRLGHRIEKEGIRHAVHKIEGLEEVRFTAIEVVFMILSEQAQPATAAGKQSM